MTCKLDCPIERVSSIAVPAQPYMYSGGSGGDSPILIPAIAGAVGGSAVLALVVFVIVRHKKQVPIVTTLPGQFGGGGGNELVVAATAL